MEKIPESEVKRKILSLWIQFQEERDYENILEAGDICIKLFKMVNKNPSVFKELEKEKKITMRELFFFRKIFLDQEKEMSNCLSRISFGIQCQIGGIHKLKNPNDIQNGFRKRYEQYLKQVGKDGNRLFEIAKKMREIELFLP